MAEATEERRVAGWLREKPGARTIVVAALAAAMVLAEMGSSALAQPPGKQDYDRYCASCHGADGKGQTKIGAKLGVKDFTDAKVQAAIKDEDAVKAIKDGIKDADGRTKMKAFVTGADTPLTDDEVKALVAYVRGLKS